MNKKIRLVLLMLLGLAFSNVYADNERVVLYEQSFEESDAGWGDGHHCYYDSDQRCLILKGTGDLYTNALYGKIISLDSKFYKDIKVNVTMTENPSLDNFRLGAGNNMTQLYANENNFYYDNVSHTSSLSLSSILHSIRVLFGIYSADANLTYHIQSIQVTGILAYDPTNPVPSNTISQFSDIYTLPDNSLVRIDATDVTKLSDPIWKDGSAAIFLDYNNAISSTNVPSSGMFNSTIYGIIKRNDGIVQLQGVSYQVTGSNNSSLVNREPTSISENDYFNYVGKYVEMPITSNVIISNATIAGEEYIVSPLSSNSFRVCGVVMPNNNNERRLLYAGTEYPAKYLLYSENLTNTINSDCLNSMCYIRRSFEKDKWYSLILPFNFSSYYGTLAVFTSSENGVLSFSTTNNVTAGRPFLFKPNSDMTKLSSKVIIDNNDLQYEQGGEYNFVGTFNSTQPNNGSYYLAAGATIKPLSSGGTIKGLRAYFEPNTPAAARTRSITLDIDGQTTAISDVVWGDEDDNTEAIYDLKGQYVGNNKDALRKGVYIINGKKFMK